jgi:lipopolysaccharide/colanic/teichoic acid biosynthesis glycosyltransferase
LPRRPLIDGFPKQPVVRAPSAFAREEWKLVTLLGIDKASSTRNRATLDRPAEEREVLAEEGFLKALALERKRSERSKNPFLLMLLETGRPPRSATKRPALDGVIAALLSTTRATDVVGWYQRASVVGVIFTGLSAEDKSATLSTLLNKVNTALRSELTFEEFSQISISFHFFPDNWHGDGEDGSNDAALYPDCFTPVNGKVGFLGVKRAMDIAVSLLMLLAGLPFFIVIALAIKATSEGPVLYRQKRVGQYGRIFTFLKFRSMYVNNDHNVHREYVSQLIAGNAERMAVDGSKDSVYKIANDKRITPLGSFLRKTSTDELPQLFNVLRGDMSLVGPRPPIPYELAAYQTWHRRRLLQVKPGITGLWQVTGRSRVTFDEMVRLDLQYATTWSPWLDVKILLQTPAAVVKGAY